MQRVSDSWRATAGSTAISVINTVFENSDDNFLTDDDRQAFAQRQLDSLEFLFGDVESTVWTIFLFSCQLLINIKSSRTAIFFKDLSFFILSQLTTVLFMVLSRFPLWEIQISVLISRTVRWPYLLQRYVSFHFIMCFWFVFRSIVLSHLLQTATSQFGLSHRASCPRGN